MVRISLVLVCLLFSSCYTITKILNYPFRSSEILASFPIDPNSREEQIFILDNIRTEKHFKRLDGSIGPYKIDICKDDTTYAVNHHMKLLVTMRSETIEPRTEIRKELFYTGLGCNGLDGWNVASFVLPKDFDLGQKVIIILQILEDRDDFLKTLTNPKLVFFAGTGRLK